jgi:hypothetical protein
MAKGKNQPSGVRCFGYAKQDTRGKAHPDTVNSGQAAVESYGGGQGAITLASGGANASAARKLSGTDNMGAKVKHLNASHGGPKAAGANTDARPEGVRVFKDASV